VRDEDRALAYELKQDPVDSPVEQDYKRLSDELYQLKLHLEQLQMRKKNIQIINDQVGGWSKRVGKKLADQLEDHTLSSRPTNML
jgi:hypothetical protein